jgi:hypothetical protein
MRKISVTLAVTALMLLLLVSALAFSVTLQNLRINTFSFARPAAASVIAVPMTSADEAAIMSPESNTVRFEEFQQPQHVCDKNKARNRTTDF